MAQKTILKDEEFFEVDGRKYTRQPDIETFLNESGLKKNSISRILKAFDKENIDSVSQIVSMNQSAISTIDQISDKAAVKIVKHSLLMINKGKFVASAAELREREGDYRYLSTGSSVLDELMTYANAEIGWRSTNMVEIFGEPSMGKTQIAHTAAIMCMRKEMDGGWDRGVAYIDSEGAFELSHFESIARYYGIPREELDKKFFHSRVKNFDEVELALEEIGKMAPKDQKDIGVIIVDSLMDPLKAQYPTGMGDFGNLQPRQKHLKRVLDMMKNIATMNNSLVIYTNHVIKNITVGSFGGGPDMIPLGGTVLGHASDIRIKLQSPNKAQREAFGIDSQKLKEVNLKFARATIVDCGFLPEATGFYLIGPFGVSDPVVKDTVMEQAKKVKDAGYMCINAKGESLDPPDDLEFSKQDNLDRNIKHIYGTLESKDEKNGKKADKKKPKKKPKKSNKKSSKQTKAVDETESSVEEFDDVFDEEE